MSKVIGIDIGSDTIKAVTLRGSAQTVCSLPIEGEMIRKVGTQPAARLLEVLEGLARSRHETVVCGITGSGGAKLGKLIGATFVDIERAVAKGVNRLYPDVRTVIGMGYEKQFYILFEQDEESGRLLVSDSAISGKCASGSGSFIEAMAKERMNISLEEFCRLAATGEPASTSGRCAVFGESDWVHLRNDGVPIKKIAAGIVKAAADNFFDQVGKDKEFVDMVAFVGGVSDNQAMIKYLNERLETSRVFVPKHNQVLGAIGAAFEATGEINILEAIAKIKAELAKKSKHTSTAPLKSLGAVAEVAKEDDPLPRDLEMVAIGVDVGSISTKAKALTWKDGKWRDVAKFYQKTGADPVTAVREVMDEIERQIVAGGYVVGKYVAGATGSGRYLTGHLIGADVVKNEITSQKSGVLAYADDVTTIFEIGGQDSKYIRLKGDVTVNFEMNKACSAGTGAFLEKQAARLGIPIQEFGGVALSAKAPAELDFTCTVICEQGLAGFQQAFVPVEDLAAGICTASARNYVTKTVGQRPTDGKVVFTGAVAFNEGLRAAIEMEIGRPIIVPPDPHLTGPTGIARLAYLANPEKSKFRGFKAIKTGKFERKTRSCRGCDGNECELHIFELEDGSEHISGDRCEMFSRKNRPLPEKQWPNLFKERDDKIASLLVGNVPKGAKRVGVPRGLMFDELFPMVKGFFSALGFEVVPSDPANRTIIKQGLKLARAEFCFPMKVAHGYVWDVLQKGVDILFLPGVYSAEQPNSELRQAQTCPYIQAAPEVIGDTIEEMAKDVMVLRPRLHLKRGIKHLRSVFVGIGQQLGKTDDESLKALEVGLKALDELRQWMFRRGQEALASLGPNDQGIVVFARPYTEWDPAINMKIADRILEQGVLAIPQSFLALESADITKSWPKVYSRQIQRKLLAAEIVRNNPKLRALVLNYFGCGQDSYGNLFMQAELDEPCYVMQIDEHTGDAGVITRVEAYLDSKGSGDHENFVPPRSDASSFGEIKKRLLWIPKMGDPCLPDGSDVLAASFSAFGIKAKALDRSPDPSCTSARKALGGEDICLPGIMTLEDMIHRVNHGFDRFGEAFFIGNSEGPCRFGMYSMQMRRVLDDMGYKDVPVATIGSMDDQAGLGIRFGLFTWAALVTHDLLLRMLHRTRPYEIEKGASDAVFEKAMKRLLAEMANVQAKMPKSWILCLVNAPHMRCFKRILRSAQREFQKVPKYKLDLPLVGVIGEFYVRGSADANQDVVRKLEAEGAETWQSPLTEFFAYANYIRQKLLSDMKSEGTMTEDDGKELRNRVVNTFIMGKYEHSLFECCLPILEGREDIGPEEVVEKGQPYINYNFGGEAVCSMGKSEDFVANRDISGIVAVLPFNCMPGLCVKAMSVGFRRKHGRIPFLNLDYDGFEGDDRDRAISNFMWQVKERYEGRKARMNAA